MCNKDDIWSPSTCTCENGKYLENFIDNSVNICDEIIDAIRSEPTKYMATTTRKKP